MQIMEREAEGLKKRFDRLWARDEHGCHVWTGAVGSNGGGVFSVDGRQMGAARASWLITHLTLPDGGVVFTTCGNPLCVNPAHLRVGTRQDVYEQKLQGRAIVQPTMEDARHIRFLREQNPKEYTLRRLVEEFGFSMPTISNIIAGRTWKEREDESESA